MKLHFFTAHLVAGLLVQSKDPAFLIPVDFALSFYRKRTKHLNVRARDPRPGDVNFFTPPFLLCDITHKSPKTLVGPGFLLQTAKIRQKFNRGWQLLLLPRY